MTTTTTIDYYSLLLDAVMHVCEANPGITEDEIEAMLLGDDGGWIN